MRAGEGGGERAVFVLRAARGAKRGRGTTKSRGVWDESRPVLAESSQVFERSGREGTKVRGECEKNGRQRWANEEKFVNLRSQTIP